MKSKIGLIMLFCLIGSSLTLIAGETRIRLASTTSTQNSGLLESILPLFEKKAGCKVDVIAVGTGAAIELGKRGDADVVLVHAKEMEEKAVKEGFFINRHDVMVNDFVIVGPASDPAKIKGSATAAEAFGTLIGRPAVFVSRGDNSGTHLKEQAIWAKVGTDPRDRPGYLQVGQGMEKTLRIASEKQAYTLTDRGTWLGMKDKDTLGLIIILEGDPTLLNQYGIMAVNPEKQPLVQHKLAMQLIDWFISLEGQQAIGSFKDKNGTVLFTPNAR
jgi:tungstate transport system substrate-binding protein